MIETIIYSIVGGCLYRWRGMAHRLKRFFPRPFNQIAFALPYAAACIPPNTNSWAIPAVVLVVTTLGVLSGHGGFMDLGGWHNPRKDETMEWVIKPLHSKLSAYWYDALGLAGSGLYITLPAGLALMPYNLHLGLVIAISGALKAPAYMVATGNTAAGEILTGAVLWGSLTVLLNAF